MCAYLAKYRQIPKRKNFPLQGPVAVKVQVPNMQDKTEWKLNGQVLNFTVPLTDQVCECCFIVSIY